MVKRPDTFKLVDEFAQAVAGQTDAVWRGDHREGNTHAKRYLSVFQRLRAMGDPGSDALVALLNHERIDVRVMTAAFLLRHRTAEAIAVLREAAKGTGMIAFEAAQAITMWEEGTWTLDPADDMPRGREPDRDY